MALCMSPEIIWHASPCALCSSVVHPWDGLRHLHSFTPLNTQAQAAQRSPLRDLPLNLLLLPPQVLSLAGHRHQLAGCCRSVVAQWALQRCRVVCREECLGQSTPLHGAYGAEHATTNEDSGCGATRKRFPGTRLCWLIQCEPGAATTSNPPSAAPPAPPPP